MYDKIENSDFYSLREKLEQLFEQGLLLESPIMRIERINKMNDFVKKCKTDEELNKYEKLFKALASKTRLMILKLMMSGIQCSCEIEHVLRLSQSTVSHHLKLLTDAGIITAEKTGKWSLVKLQGKQLSKEFFIKLIIDS